MPEPQNIEYKSVWKDKYVKYIHREQSIKYRIKK